MMDRFTGTKAVRTAAVEYVKHGIRVNPVNPDLTDTQVARDVVGGDERAYAELEKQVPIGREGRPEEIRYAVERGVTLRTSARQRRADVRRS